MKKIFSNFGCEIYEVEGQTYVYFDSGESSGSSVLKAKINDSQFERIQKSEEDAYRVILSLEPFCQPVDKSSQ